MIKLFPICLIVCLGLPLAAAAEPSRMEIRVDAKAVIAHVTPFTTGACLEDVNHEVYGGIYSQMIFGESFQEPAASEPPKGFHAYGGEWIVKENGELVAGAGDGPKLISDEPAFSAGEVSVEIMLTDSKPGNVALILKVDQPETGADRWIGYEIGLSEGSLLLGRHRNNWEPIRTVPAPIALNRWVTLTVKLTESALDISIDGKPIMQFEDREHPLASGRVGLRTWQRTARFRNLKLVAGGQTKSLAFHAPDAGPWQGSVSGMWRPIHRGSAQGASSLNTAHSFVGVQSQTLRFISGDGEIGLENQGLGRWGMNYVAGKSYDGYVWARSETGIDIFVAMESADGSKTYGEQKLALSGGADWQRLDFKLTPDASDTHGRFAIKLKQPGSISLGHAFLQPGEWGRFKGLPVRKDVAEALVAQGITVLRYGGSMVNAADYRWKKMIGPRDRRVPYTGWHPHTSNGWGIIDFIEFCEAAGFQFVPAFNMDETPQDMADFTEYVNGPPDSEWGRKRVADGHPEPFHLKYLELGNEEAVNDAYWKRFEPMAQAIWAKDRTVVPVVGDFAYGEHIADPYQFKGAPSITTLAAHKKILDLAAGQHQAVWFDCHVWNDSPLDPVKQIDVLGELGVWLRKLSPSADFKICVFEENSGNHAMRRALAHARAINGLERLGDLVPIVSAANCLQPDGQNDNGWDQGLLFLNPGKVWGQPPYYVTQMISKNYLPNVVKAEMIGEARGLDVTARASADGKTLTLQIMNPDKNEAHVHVHVDGFAPASDTAAVSQLAGDLGAVNTADHSDQVVPTEQTLKVTPGSGDLSVTLPPTSFTIVRLK